MKAVSLVALVLMLTAIAAVAAYFVGSPEEAALRAGAVGTLALLVLGGGTYLVLYTIRMRELDSLAGRPGESEVPWVKTARAVHYKSGKPRRFWEAVGGKLFLTSEALEFRANPMEWWVYRIQIPLREVKLAVPCQVGFVSGGLRIERRDGTFELFTFGAAFDVSREWADAIVELRDGPTREGRA